MIATNGKIDASIMMHGAESTSDEVTMVMAAVLPLALRPEAKTVANIGFGSGMTTHNLLGAARLERVDTVEIEQAMVDGACGFGPFVERAYTDPRSRIYIDDAKTYFSSHNARYDIIVSEPSNPWVSGVANLFSEEFYRYIQRHLNERGLLVQWLQLYESNLTLVSSVFQALAEHFNDYVVFNTSFGDILIIASNGGALDQIDSAILAEPQLQEQLQRVGLRSVSDLKARRIGDKKLLHPLFLAAGAPINSDFFPYLSLNAPRSRYLGETAFALTELGEAPIPVLEMLDGHPRASEQPLTVTSDFLMTQFQQQARRFAEVLSTPTTATATSMEDLGRAGFDLQLLMRELAVSAPQAPADKIVRAVLLNLASAVNPYLPASQLAPLWETLASQPGYSALSELTRNWFALHQAIGSRDAAAMASLAAHLLETTPKEQLSAQETSYLLTAGLTGALAQGDQKQAYALLEIFSKQQKPIPELPLYLKLLGRRIE